MSPSPGDEPPLWQACGRLCLIALAVIAGVLLVGYCIATLAASLA